MREIGLQRIGMDSTATMQALSNSQTQAIVMVKVDISIRCLNKMMEGASLGTEEVGTSIEELVEVEGLRGVVITKTTMVVMVEVDPDLTIVQEGAVVKVEGVAIVVDQEDTKAWMIMDLADLMDKETTAQAEVGVVEEKWS